LAKHGTLCGVGRIDHGLIKDDIQGLEVHIGSHGDWLEDISPSERLRAPVITVENALRKGEAKITNPYGGLIHIKPTLLKTAKPTTKLTIKRAIKALTNIKEWPKFAKDPKVPMAELRSKKVILMVLSKYLKDAYGWELHPKLFTAMWELPADRIVETDSGVFLETAERGDLAAGRGVIE